jgi:hypothetical protein
MCVDSFVCSDVDKGLHENMLFGFGGCVQPVWRSITQNTEIHLYTRCLLHCIAGMTAHNKNATSQELSTVLDSLSRLADLEQRISGACQSRPLA